MLNENHSGAVTPASVTGGDFVGVPKLSLPLSQSVPYIFFVDLIVLFKANSNNCNDLKEN